MRPRIEHDRPIAQLHSLALTIANRDRVHLDAPGLQVDERELAVPHVHQRDPDHRQDQPDAVAVDVGPLALLHPAHLPAPAGAEGVPREARSRSTAPSWNNENPSIPTLPDLRR